MSSNNLFKAHTKKKKTHCEQLSLIPILVINAHQALKYCNEHLMRVFEKSPKATRRGKQLISYDNQRATLPELAVRVEGRHKLWETACTFSNVEAEFSKCCPGPVGVLGLSGGL